MHEDWIKANCTECTRTGCIFTEQIRKDNLGPVARLITINKTKCKMAFTIDENIKPIVIVKEIKPEQLSLF